MCPAQIPFTNTVPIPKLLGLLAITIHSCHLSLENCPELSHLMVNVAIPEWPTAQY